MAPNDQKLSEEQMQYVVDVVNEHIVKKNKRFLKIMAIIYAITFIIAFVFGLILS